MYTIIYIISAILEFICILFLFIQTNYPLMDSQTVIPYIFIQVLYLTCISLTQYTTLSKTVQISLPSPQTFLRCTKSVPPYTNLGMLFSPAVQNVLLEYHFLPHKIASYPELKNHEDLGNCVWLHRKLLLEFYFPESKE